MNLYQLRYFSLLAKTGHFRKTAEQLCITQPSLSHSISLLEQELGACAAVGLHDQILAAKIAKLIQMLDCKMNDPF